MIAAEQTRPDVAEQRVLWRVVQGELDPDKPIIAYCKSGVRSLHAVEILQALGRNDAASMSGGIIAWYEAGQPLDQ